MRKQKGLSLLFAGTFLIFLGILDYPFVSRIYNEYVQGKVAADYEASVKELEETYLIRERERAQAYNRELTERGIRLSDAFAETQEQGEIYESLLNTEGNGIMGLIEIPKIELSLPVYHGTEEEALQKGAGHLEGSSLPVGGSSTHTCISAHRGLPDKTMFTNLDQLKEGDVFFFKILGNTLAYEVYAIETAEPWQTDSLAIREEEDLATLITCTPYGVNTHRLYIHGRRIPFEEKEEGQTEAAAQPEEAETWIRRYGWIGLNILLLSWMFFLLYRVNGGGKRRQK